jgi:hypothetical protein
MKRPKEFLLYALAFGVPALISGFFGFSDMYNDGVESLAKASFFVFLALTVLTILIYYGGLSKPPLAIEVDLDDEVEKFRDRSGKQDYVLLPRDRYSVAAENAYYEILRARKKHGQNDFNSTHEGYGVIKEELDEAWDEIKRDNVSLATKEMNQVAAMAIRFSAEF